MNFLPGVTWSNPEATVFILFFIVLIGLVIYSARKRKQAYAILKLVEQGQHFISKPPKMRRFKTLLYLVGTFFVMLACIGPQWGQKPNAIKAQGLDLCFAVDISLSMLAEDMAPSRLQQAKNQLSIFLPRLGGDRAALVAFAGSGYIASPLTVDHNAIVQFLDPMQPDFITYQATDITSGVQHCLDALGLSEVEDANEISSDAAKVIVMLTDGDENLEDSKHSVAKAEKLGVPVHVFAYGTVKGGPIPKRGPDGTLNDYLKDPATGQPAVTRLEEGAIKELVQKTGGQVYYASRGIDAWTDFEKVLGTYKRDSRDAGTKAAREDRFQWPLAIGILCLMIDFLLPETGFHILLWLFFGLGLGFYSPASLASGQLNSNPLQIYKNNKATKHLLKGEHRKAENLMNDALAENAQDALTRFNWASDQILIAAMAEKSTDEKKNLDPAIKELERLEQEIESSKDPELQTLRKRIRRQLGHAYELSKNNKKAIENYYKSLALQGSTSKITKNITPSTEATAPASNTEPEFKKMDEDTKHNIARLLKKQEQNSSSQGGGEGSDNKDSKDGSKPEDKKNPAKDGENADQGKQKPKFSGTDLNEGQAEQIMESVSGEEKEVQKRQAKAKAGKEKGSGKNSPKKPW